MRKIGRRLGQNDRVLSTERLGRAGRFLYFRKTTPSCVIIDHRRKGKPRTTGGHKAIGPLA